VVDFYCPKARLIVELLGSVHLGLDASEYDEYRKKYLESLRMTILEFWNGEVEKDMEGVVARISLHLEER
jgi:very-short-patch-repair endonuclease